jgi:sulfur carrier protein
MIVTINDQQMELEAPLTVQELLIKIDRHQLGTALAINEVLIPRPYWAERTLSEGDNILLFQAIAGG